MIPCSDASHRSGPKSLDRILLSVSCHISASVSCTYSGHKTPGRSSPKASKTRVAVQIVHVESEPDLRLAAFNKWAGRSALSPARGTMPERHRSLLGSMEEPG